MKLLLITGFLLTLTALSSCAVVGGIFKAGMGVGIFLVIVVIAVIAFIAMRLGKK